VADNACEELAQLVEKIAAQHTDAKGFLVALGQDAADIHTGPRALLDLLIAGRTELPGGGFKPELRDHSGSQSRHFAGIARSVTVLGAKRTVWISENLRRDKRDSADGRLTLLAVEFASGLLDGELEPVDAGAWIRSNLCGA
jgi:hypothetical protein